jgi:hypothetical protein
MKATATVALHAIVLAGCGGNDRPGDQWERTEPATQESTNEPAEQPAEEADGSLQVGRTTTATHGR